MRIKKEGNRISFRSSVINKKRFSTILSSFAFAATLIFRIRDRVRINFLVSLLVGLLTTIRTGRTKILSISRLIGNIFSTIRTGTTKILSNTKMIGRIISTVSLKAKIIPLLREIQRTMTTIKTGRLKINTSVIVATFFTLGVHDPIILETHDEKTLGDMDYVVV